MKMKPFRNQIYADVFRETDTNLCKHIKYSFYRNIRNKVWSNVIMVQILDNVETQLKERVK